MEEKAKKLETYLNRRVLIDSQLFFRSLSGISCAWELENLFSSVKDLSSSISVVSVVIFAIKIILECFDKNTFSILYRAVMGLKTKKFEFWGDF